MEIETSRFGTIEIEEEKIITMVRGILGFPEYKKYVLIPHRENSPFHWLQSIEQPDLAFVVISPNRFFDDYVFDISDTVQEELKIESVDQVDVLVIVTISPDNPGEITANLLGPIIINAERKLGCQIVLDPNIYPVRFPLSSGTQKPQHKETKMAVNGE